jgi:amidase
MTTQLTDAVGTAHAIRDGEVSAREVVEAAIARIEKHDPDLNAVVGRRFDAALAEVQAGLPDGPLCGVPIVIKDLGANVAGLPSTQGSRLFADHVAADDSELVARYRRAGLVVLGTTNTPELGLNANTEPVLHGSTRNPWAPTHSPGGSSGGSAAAVAAGMVPVAHGSDGGGSIRIPAAMCGLFGLKPSRGRVPAKPYTSFLTSPLSVHHALTTTVRDSALLLDIAAGHTYGDAYGAPGPDRPYVEQVGLPPGPLRIGWTVDTANDTVSTDPQCAAAVERMVALCADLGHELVPLPLDVDAGTAAAANGTLMAASLANTVDRRLAELGRELRDDDLEPFTHVLLEHGRTLTAAQLVEALRVAQETGWRLGAAFGAVDLLLTPTVARRTPPLGLLDMTRPESLYEHGLSFSSYTSIFNLTGMPAMSVPAGLDDDGRPLGAHFAADLGTEGLLFRLAGQLEEAAPWPRLAPGYSD